MKNALIFISCFALSCSSFACSLWAVSASTSQEMFVAKNRDWAPDHEQVLELVTPKQGFRFFGLKVQGNQAPGFKMGINEKGLSVVTASLSSFPKKLRLKKHKKGILTELLTRFKNIDEVLQAKDIFASARPMVYMLADGKKMANVEISLDGKYNIDVQTTGILSHTNHLLSKDLKNPQETVSASSLTRLNRLNTLLKGTESWSVSAMKSISQDKHDGPDQSLWRLGSTAKKTRTLSSWILHYPNSASPTLYLHIANPGKEVKELTIELTPHFWEKKFSL